MQTKEFVKLKEDFLKEKAGAIVMTLVQDGVRTVRQDYMEWVPLTVPYEVIVWKLNDVLIQEVVHIEPGIEFDGEMYRVLEIENIQYELDWDATHEMFKTHFTHRHLCTDTYVGSGWISFNGTVFALFNKTARKNPCEFKFISTAHLKLARDTLLSLADSTRTWTGIVMEDDENLFDFMQQ